LFAEWELESEKVKALARGGSYIDERSPVRSIVVPNEWYPLVAADAAKALSEQLRIRAEFEKAFADSLLCRGFDRNADEPKYLLFED
jgi:hypothetical protein